MHWVSHCIFQLSEQSANLQREFKASYGGTTLQHVASNIVDAAKQFVCAGGFISTFSMHRSGIEVEVSHLRMSAVFKMWHEDVKKKKDTHIVSITVTANFVET